jgi:alpha/beta superfamily hydrolase
MSEDAVEVRTDLRLAARREDVELRTEDGLRLVGELALPADREPVATLVCLHPLPTAGGFMDSHVLRKAAARLPALAGLAVLRFNTRGTRSARGRSDGVFGDGVDERLDLLAAMDLVALRRLPSPWLLGWSFGTEVALKHGRDLPVEGLILLSPPLHRTSPAELAAWRGAGKRLVVLVPELDDYLRPDAARERFAVVPEARLVPVDGAKHLWVGESSVRRVLDEIVATVNPSASPLPTSVPRVLLAD